MTSGGPTKALTRLAIAAALAAGAVSLFAGPASGHQLSGTTITCTQVSGTFHDFSPSDHPLVWHVQLGAGAFQAVATTESPPGFVGSGTATADISALTDQLHGTSATVKAFATWPQGQPATATAVVTCGIPQLSPITSPATSLPAQVGGIEATAPGSTEPQHPRSACDPHPGSSDIHRLNCTGSRRSRRPPKAGQPRPRRWSAPRVCEPSSRLSQNGIDVTGSSSEQQPLHGVDRDCRAARSEPPRAFSARRLRSRAERVGSVQHAERAARRPVLTIGGAAAGPTSPTVLRSRPARPRVKHRPVARAAARDVAPCRVRALASRGTVCRAPIAG